MKYMGVDYGDRRTGLALSDATCLIAVSAGVIEESGMERAAAMVAQRASEAGADEIILGYPKNMNNTLGPRAKKTEQFRKLVMKSFPGPVRLWDERGTTVSAHMILNETNTRGAKRKQKVDAVAACVLLQSFLDGLR